MFGSPIFDVAMGMVFLYLLLSLIASAVQELLATLVQARSANLLRGIRSLFSGSVINGMPLFSKLYDHGLVRGLYQDPRTDFIGESRFTLVLRNASGYVRLFLRRTFGLIPPGITPHPNDLLLPAYIPSRTFGLAVRDMLAEGLEPGGNLVENIAAKLDALRTANPDDKALQALHALVLDAGQDTAKLQANLENWFNDAMDRVSGWYKHYVQKVLLVLGLGIAVALNVDSVRLARTLWVDKEARQGLVNAATDYLDKHKQVDDTTGCGDGKSPDKLACRLKGTVASFDEVTRTSLLPVGWGESFDTYWRGSNTWRSLKVLELLMGWLVTGVALSYGAPFWFDILNKIMVVRGTVKPQEKSQPEHSKDG